MRNSFFALFAFAFLSRAESFRAVDLGDLGVGDWVGAVALNNHGVVVGWATVVVNLEWNSRYDRAFIWDSTNGMVQLGSLGGMSMATVISDSGVVAGLGGTDRTGDLKTGLFFRTNGMVERFPDSTKQFHSFEPRGINKLGQILCNYGDGTGRGWMIVWHQNQAAPFDYPGARWVLGSAIKDAGIIVGSLAMESLPSEPRAFICTNGVFTFLKSPFGKGANAFSINNSGKIVGSLRDGRTEYSAVPFLYESGALRLLPLPEGAVSGAARQINDFNEILGDAEFKDSSRPIYWRNGAPVDLTKAANNVVISPGGWNLNTPFSSSIGINNLRQIVLRTRAGDGQRAVLLSPIIKLTCQGITSGLVTLEISGLEGRSHVIESSPTLSGPWSQRTNFVLRAERPAFELSRSHDAQFYRAYATLQ